MFLHARAMRLCPIAGDNGRGLATTIRTFPVNALTTIADR
jgi:hypothetical protein